MRESLIPHPKAAWLVTQGAAMNTNVYEARSKVSFPTLMTGFVALVLGLSVGVPLYFEGYTAWGILFITLALAIALPAFFLFWRIGFGKTVKTEFNYKDDSEAFRGAERWARIREKALIDHARPVYEHYYALAMAYSIQPTAERQKQLRELSDILKKFADRQQTIDVRRANAKAEAKLGTLSVTTGDPAGDAKSYLAALDELNAKYNAHG